MAVNKEITREKLILAGERLVAIHGVEGMSLRKVGLEAGQKNTSAALFHVGTKEGLLLAIFDYRMGHVDERRHDLLDTDDGSIEALVRAWILPDIEEIISAAGGSYHAQFLVMVSNHPEFNFQKLWNIRYASSYKRIAEGLRKLLPELPEQVFGMRFGMAMMQSIYSIANQERLLTIDNTHTNDEQIAEPLFVSNLIDVMVAILTAPLSMQTKKEL